MESFLEDLTLAVRSLRKAPSFALIAIATLALGIGVNTAVFSLVEGLLLRPLPYRDAHRLVRVYETQPGENERAAAPANFLDWRRDSRSFEGLASYVERRRNLIAGDEPAQIAVASVSANFVEVVGLPLSLGRAFRSGAEGDKPEAVLSHALWVRRFGSDPGAVGRTIRIDENSYEVTGVLGPGAAFPDDAELWTRAPKDVPEVGLPIGDDPTTLRDAHFLGVVGRLGPQATFASAQAEMTTIAKRLEKAFPEENVNGGVRLAHLRDDLVGPTRPTLALMTGAVAFVLLIALVNVAGLLLARAMKRGREIAVRTALGAGRRRLAQQLFAEGLVLALSSGLLGMGLAAWGVPLLRAALPGDLPGFATFRIDLGALAFTLAISIVSAILLSLLPLLAAPSLEPAQALRGGRTVTLGRVQQRLHGGLVASELALAVVLVAGTGLLLKSVWRLETADSGITRDAVVTFRVSLPAARSQEASVRKAFYQEVVDRVAAMPGVRHAAAIQTLPFAGGGISAGLRVKGRSFAPGEEVDTSWRVVTPDYFAALGVPLLRGRLLDARDGAEAPTVAVINQTLARRLWPDADPVGQQIGTGMDDEREGESFVTIVGVVGDVPQRGIAAGVAPQMYRPLAQETRFSAESMSVAVRVTGPPAAVSGSLREAVRSVNPQAPLYDVKGLDELRRATTARERGAGAALALFGALALILSAIGLYGVLNFVVGERLREFGVRMALGARPADILGHVIGGGLRLVAAGLVLGLGAALGLGRFLAGLLYGVPASDATTLAGVVVVLGSVALFASYLPARRAAGADPILALRQE
jgi:putative ABC transport system permease protein